MNTALSKAVSTFVLGFLLFAPSVAAGDPQAGTVPVATFDGVQLMPLPASGRTPPDPWPVADASALRAIQEEGHNAVQALVARLKTTDIAGRRELQLRITETKRAFELRFLYALVTRALQRGDVETARQGQKALDRFNAVKPATLPEADPLASKRRAIGER